ncbi:MAG: hypothetical protein AB3N20_01805 [Rhizobiaceae bacterium]
MVKAAIAVGLVFGIAAGAVGAHYAPLAWQHLSVSHQPYAGQQARRISSLSEADINSLEKGEGWGLAKPAELNGYPGPAHVLEFADKLDLDSEQLLDIEAAFEAMRTEAIELGNALVAAELALDEAFRSGKITPEVLAGKLNAAAEIRVALRAVHLNAHLRITPLLSDDQKQKYAALRGYSAGHDGHSGH